MIGGKDYRREIQKFTTSQYWNSGVRITAGVMLPLLVLIHQNWLSSGIPFLWGSLFVSLTDTPGPIHHRRNGMIAALVLNSFTVLVTAFTREYQVLLLLQIIVFGFFLSLGSIYGARAGAVGSLALVVMLLNLLTLRENDNTFRDSLLIAAGGSWYMILSLLLYRLRPYRPVEQALGENLIAIAGYVRARATFYKDGANMQDCFNRVMEEQSAVLKIQDQLQELLFKTRKFVADASPKSRSMMMIYLDSLDLFEQTMYSYQDYEQLHRTLGHTDLLTRFYSLILQIAAEMEHIGIFIQQGIPVKKDLDMTSQFSELHDHIKKHLQQETARDRVHNLLVLDKTLGNAQNIVNRINKLVLYTRLELDEKVSFEAAQYISRIALTQPVSFRALIQNLTLESNTFRHALRLTVAMVLAYAVSVLFSLTHPYWVLLTIVTIMKPVYQLTRKRNIERVAGTAAGVVVVSVILYFVSNQTALLVFMILCMLVGYSLLRVNYFSFVVFLTVFVIISFHFLNPSEFKMLIRERLVDTVIGSIISFIAARFIFPVWSVEEIRSSMEKMLEANRNYFSKAWKAVKTSSTESHEYELARQHAVVALTNLSENFQRILSEPQQTKQATKIHQFVIANHMLTGHIAALSTEKVSSEHFTEETGKMVKLIEAQLQKAENRLKSVSSEIPAAIEEDFPSGHQTLNQLSMIYALAVDIHRIAGRL